MKVLLTTDTHFNHKRMIEFGRPENFEQLIWENLLKECVQPDRLLIHLGDVCIGNDVEVHAMLQEMAPCPKVLVRGNHDKKSNSWYLRHGWDFVCETFVDTYYGKKILFSHEPKNEKIYDFNIHGHLHDAGDRYELPLNLNNKLLALEYTDYKPVYLERFLHSKP